MKTIEIPESLQDPTAGKCYRIARFLKEVVDEITESTPGCLPVPDSLYPSMNSFLKQLADLEKARSLCRQISEYEKQLRGDDDNS